MPLIYKAGASPKASPAVCLTNVGSRDASQVSKFQALAEAVGPAIWRTTDGRHVQITAQEQKFISVHKGSFA